ncbi:MAG: hypothetical protein ACE5FF_13035 [Saprospiraceae bacterium]
MKNLIKLFTMAMIWLSPWNLLATTTSCECGEHETGITSYTVSGEDCCLSPVAPDTIGFFYEYENQGGVWRLINTTKLDANQAKNDCCLPS